MTEHTPTGRARVRWVALGKEHTRYLGDWGSATAREAYKRFVAEWNAGMFAAPAAGGAGVGVGVGVGGLVARRIVFARREYRKEGKLTSEYHCQRAALAPLNELYGDTLAAEFTPAKLKAVREAMVAKGWARSTINLHVSRIVSVFGWAVAEGWLPAAVPAALREVAGLKAGKTTAPERARKVPAPDADLTAVLPHLSPLPERRSRLVAMVRVQRLTGMRPGEACALRPCDLDRSADVWLYTVADRANKNLHKGKTQRYWIGPRAQAELLPHLDGPADRPVFRTSRGDYSLAVRLACEAVNAERSQKGESPLKPWTPHQLRHSLATDVAGRSGP